MNITPHREFLGNIPPSLEVLRHITNRSAVKVLSALAIRVHRFNEMQRAIDVSKVMLAQTLQWLEHDGLVDRIAFSERPPHVEYQLTPLGREAAELVNGLTDWIERNLPKIQQAQEASKKP